MLPRHYSTQVICQRILYRMNLFQCLVLAHAPFQRILVAAVLFESISGPDHLTEE